MGALSGRAPPCEVLLAIGMVEAEGGFGSSRLKTLAEASGFGSGISKFRVKGDSVSSGGGKPRRPERD